MLEQINVKIKNISPILLNRFPEESLNIAKLTPEKQAESAAYRTKDGNLYFPGTNIQRAIIAGATFSKGKGRASLQKEVCACVMVSPEIILFESNHYEIDRRAVVNPSTKGRIFRYRPRINEWILSFKIEYDNDLLSEEQIKKVVEDTGIRIGIGDFRPSCKGSFGRFQVVEWGQ